MEKLNTEREVYLASRREERKKKKAKDLKTVDMCGERVDFR